MLARDRVTRLRTLESFDEFAVCIVSVYFSRLQSPDFPRPQVIYWALYFGSMSDIPRMATARGWVSYAGSVKASCQMPRKVEKFHPIVFHKRARELASNKTYSVYPVYFVMFKL